MIRTRLAFAPLLSIVLLVYTTSGAAASYVQDPYTGVYNRQLQNNWCVVASARTWLQYIPGSNVQSQATIQAYMQTKDHIQPPLGANDPFGWAWAMHHYAPSYGFNWYSGSQVAMNWEMVLGIRATNQPVGAIVEAPASNHAVDIIGYSTVNDPFSTKPQTLNGFYIIDPWYGNKDSGMLNWPYNGFSPNTFVAISTWDSLYFLNTKDAWDYNYVVVLRSVGNADPVMSHRPQTYGDYVYGTMYGAIPSVTLANPSVSASMGDAIVQGFQQNGLADGGALGVSLTGYTVGTAVHVDSLVQQIPSYDLVEIDVDKHVRAVAMVTEEASGYSFAAVTPWTGSFDLASQGAINNALASTGMAGPGRFVWAWTDDGGSPFAPMIEARDAKTSARAYLSATGRHNQLSLVPGETPSGR